MRAVGATVSFSHRKHILLDQHLIKFNFLFSIYCLYCLYIVYCLNISDRLRRLKVKERNPMTLKILFLKRILKCYLLTTNKIMDVNHLFFKEKRFSLRNSYGNRYFLA